LIVYFNPTSSAQGCELYREAEKAAKNTTNLFIIAFFVRSLQLSLDYSNHIDRFEAPTRPSALYLSLRINRDTFPSFCRAFRVCTDLSEGRAEKKQRRVSSLSTTFYVDRARAISLDRGNLLSEADARVAIEALRC